MGRGNRKKNKNTQHIDINSLLENGTSENDTGGFKYSDTVVKPRKNRKKKNYYQVYSMQ